MSDELKVGQVVWLNSGSPAMTIVDVAHGRAYVNWMWEGNCLSFNFPVDCIRPTQP